MEFNISFQKSMQELTELLLKMEQLGGVLDTNELKATKTGSRLLDGLTAVATEINRVTQAYAQNGNAAGSAEAETMRLAQISQRAAKVMESLASAHSDSAVKVAGLKGELGGLQNILQETAIMRTYIRWQERQASVMTDLTERSKLLGIQLAASGTTEAQRVARLKVMLNTSEQMASADERRRSTITLLTDQLNYLTSTEAKNEAQLRVKIAEQKRLNEAEAKSALGVDARARASARLTDAMAKEIAETRELEKATKAANEAAIRRASSGNYGGRPYTRSVEQTISTATSNASNADVRAQLARNAEYGRESAGLHVNTVTESNSLARETQLANAIKIRNDYTTALAGSQRTLTEAQAATIVKTEQLAAQTERNNKAMLDAARNAAGVTGAHQSVARSIESEMAKLVELRARREALNGTQGSELRSIRASIAAEQQRIGVLEGTVRATNQVVSANGRLISSFDTSAQAGAAFRASLAGLKSSFGSFAGSTLLVASAFFAVSSQMRSTITDGMEYQKSMSRIEALTTRAGDSSQEVAIRMGQVQSAVRQQAIDSIYNARETAEGFQYLVQSGMNADTAIKSLPATLSMASVSMLSMKEAADLTTNIMSSFNLKADDMANVVDVMSTAVTNSNTTMMELGNALSYIGPSAASAGYNMQEITAAVMTLSNNGIKSSRAGTGLRGIITGLIEPSSKGIEVMRQLGIAADDAAGKTRPLTEVMEQIRVKFKELNLSEVEQLEMINKLFGRYAQSAASVLVNQNDTVKKFKQQLSDVEGSAKRAADIIRNNLSGAWENTTSAIDDVKLQAFSRLEPLLTTATLQLNNFFLTMTNSDIDQFIGKVASLTSTVVTMGKAWAGIKLTQFTASGLNAAVVGVGNLTSRIRTMGTTTVTTLRDMSFAYRTMYDLQMSNAAAGAGVGTRIRAGMAAAREAVTATTGAVGLLKGALSTLATAMGWLGTIVAVGTAAYSLYTMWASNGKQEAKEFSNLLDAQIEKQNSLRKANDAAEATRKAEELNSEIGRGTKMAGELNEQYVALSEMQEKGLGGQETAAALHAVADKINTVGSAIRGLRIELEGLNKAGDTAADPALTLGQIASERQKVDREYGSFAKKTYPTLTEEEGKAKMAENGVIGSDFRRRLDALDKKYADTTASLKKTGAIDDKGNVVDQQAKHRETINRIDKEEKEKANVVVTAATKLKAKQDEIAAKRTEASNSMASKTVQDRAREDLAKLYVEERDLKKQEAEETISLSKAQRSAYTANLTVAQLKGDLAALDKRIAEARKIGDTGELIKLYGERSQINSTLASKNKSGEKKGKKEAEEFKKAADVYNKMVESLDDGALKATRVFEERRNAIAKLFKEGSVGYTAAMVENRKAFEQEMAKLDQYHKDPKALVKSYTGKSDLTQAMEDRKTLGTRVEALDKQDLSKDSGLEADRGLTRRAYEMAKLKEREALSKGLESDATSADLGTFQSAYNGMSEYMARDERYNARKVDLKTEEAERLKNSSDQEGRESTEGKSQEEILAMHESYQKRRLEISAEYAEKEKELEQMRLEGSKTAQMQLASAVASSASTTLSSLAGMAKEGSGAQKAMLVASRAFHYAQIALSTEAAVAQINIQGKVAAANAGAAAATAGPVAAASAAASMESMYTALAVMTRVAGYTSLAMTAISDNASSSGSTSSSTSSTTETKKNVTFSGFKDKGGTIGSDEWAIVGEYGPEIVQGPANVTSRAETAAAARQAMNGGSGQSGSAINITVAPVVHVHADGDTSEESAKRQGTVTADMISALTKQTIQEELEHGGLLSRG